MTPGASAGGELTPIGRVVARRVADLLGCPVPAASDNFFALGGGSIQAAWLMAVLAAEFGAAPSAREVFLAPSIAGIARAVEQELAASSPLALRRRRRRGSFPLTAGQAAMLRFLDRADRGYPHYVMAEAYCLHGPLDRAALGRALAITMRENEPLRSLVDPAAAAQRVLRYRPLPLVEQDLQRLPPAERAGAVRRELARNQAAFDLTVEPAFRVSLLRLSRTEHVLGLCFHHVFFDGWSYAIVYRRLAELYRALNAGQAPRVHPPRPEFGDYALRQAAGSAGEVRARDLEFWRRELAGYQPAQIGLDGSRLEFSSSMAVHVTDAATTAAVQAVATAAAATPFAVLAAAFAVVLSRLVHRGDLVFASNDANRYHPDVMEMVGNLATTLLTRVRVRGAHTFGQTVQALQSRLSVNRQHQSMHWEDLVAAVDQPEAVQFRFSLQDTHEYAGLSLAGISATPIQDESPPRGRRPVAVAVTGGAGGFRVEWYGRDDVAIPPPSQAVAAFGLVLSAAVRGPHRRVASLWRLADRGAGVSSGPG